jgi:hypothetical protein
VETIPSGGEIAVHFKLDYKTVGYHVMKLIIEGRLRQERGKLVVVGSEWIEPSGLLAHQRFDLGPCGCQQNSYLRFTKRYRVSR